MPARPRRPCLTPGCPDLADVRGRCLKCNREHEAARLESGSKDPFYWSTAWRTFRAWFIKRHPLCTRCLAWKRMTRTEHVHHVIPRKERPDLALSEDNCEALCAACHNVLEPRGAA